MPRAADGSGAEEGEKKNINIGKVICWKDRWDRQSK